MNQQGDEVLPALQKRNLTSSVSNTTLNAGSRNTVTLTIPLNSHLIRATSSATRWRPWPVFSTVASTDRLAIYSWTKLSWIANKRGEVTDLRVERDEGIQSRLLPAQSTPSSTSWRFGNLEKSKDLSKVSLPPTSR